MLTKFNHHGFIRSTPERKKVNDKNYVSISQQFCKLAKCKELNFDDLDGPKKIASTERATFFLNL